MVVILNDNQYFNAQVITGSDKFIYFTEMVPDVGVRMKP
jgi:hypothetical protein